MAINVARLPDVAAAKIALPADGEIDLCHLAFLREQLVKEAGGGRVFFGEEGLDVALQVDNEVFAFVTFELRGNAFFIAHREPSFLSSIERPEMGWKLSLVAAERYRHNPSLVSSACSPVSNCPCPVLSLPLPRQGGYSRRSSREEPAIVVRARR